MASTTRFQPARDQDAWATLRGFRYQIDLSILRWLALRPNEHLELEHGEDIDLVAQALTADSDADYTRTLEQVKVRARSLTLRRDSALESLANAYDHLRANPGLNLRFCYTTNATIARERPSPFPNKTPGIVLWERARNLELSTEERSAAIQHIRKFLSLSVRPRTADETAWHNFVAFAKETDEHTFLDFVHRFEWSCAAPEPDDLSEKVRHEIRVYSGAVDDIQVDELYHRLFLSVFGVLTRSGIKRVSKQDLEGQLAAPTLSETDHALLTRLNNRFDALEQRFVDIESTVSVISDEVHSLVLQHGSQFAAIDQVGVLTVEPPPLVAHLSRRTHTVSELTRYMADKDWLAIYGLADMGKTHVAALVCDQLGKVGGWIRLSHSISTTQASVLLHEAIRGLAGQPTTLPSADLYSKACRQLGTGKCLVVDDIPSVTSDDQFVERLRLLVDACHKFQVKLISTSRHRLPTRLATALGPGRLLEIPVPRFSNEDAKDVLAAHGATDFFLSDRTVEFINALASGHPLLITLASRFLRDRNWKLDDAEFGALLRGEHAAGIADEVISRISQSLNVPQRELLYRVSLATGSLKEPVALELATVEPAIDHPRECLAGLIGAWIQRESQHELMVSPLVRGIGVGNLSDTTAVRCHVTLGEAMIRATMSPWDAQTAINHFVQARECARAGTLFLMLLDRLWVWPASPELRSIVAMWAQTPLPMPIALGLRVAIRAMQSRVLHKYGVPDQFVLSDLDRPHHRKGTSEERF